MVTRSFPNAGAKTVKLRVTDKSVPAKSSIDSVVVTITAAGQPDLTVFSHSYTPTTVQKGDQVTFTATIKNVGSAAAGSSLTEWFRYAANGLGKLRLGRVSTPSIAPNGTRQVTLTINTSTWKVGTYRIRVYTDVTNVVQEAPTDNNALYFNLTIGRR